MKTLGQSALPFCLLLGYALGLSGCANKPVQREQPSFVLHAPCNTEFSDEALNEPQDEPLSCYGNQKEYLIEGRRYQVLNSAKNYNRVGIASWYGKAFHGQLTSTRERYDMFGMTAASPDLPLPTRVRVTNLDNGRSVIVKVNDRGPFKANRLIDLSYSAAKQLGIVQNGTGKVRVEALHSSEPQTLDSLASRQILQVGAFSKADNAEHFSDKIKHLTQLPVNIKQYDENDRIVYRVEVGPFENQAALDHTQKSLEQQGVKNITARYS